MAAAGIVVALVAAVLLALGAQLQNRGVRGGRDGSTPRFGVRQALALVRSGSWLAGSGFLTLSVLLQLTALLLAPLPVVQPVGALSLVVTALLGRRVAGTRIQRLGGAGIALCVAGVGVFVVAASLTTRTSPDTVAAVVPVLVLVGVALLVLLGAYLVARRRELPAVVWALAGGACFGFVVTLMKVVLDRCSAAVQGGDLFDATAPFTALVGAGAALSGIAGISLVQAAYASASGSADLVVAALTVIDPLVAVSLGIGLLGEARGAPPWIFAVFAAAEAVSVGGVVLMARHPPLPERPRAA